MNKTIVLISLIATLLLGALVGIVLFKGLPEIPLGSVTVGNEYNATTTPFAGTWTDVTIRRGNGTLGSVIITQAGTMKWQLYNATSTGAVNNDSRFNKSANLLADFPASAIVGTYVFDVTYTDGLVIEVVTGTLGTSTITYR